MPSFPLLTCLKYFLQHNSGLAGFGSLADFLSLSLSLSLSEGLSHQIKSRDLAPRTVVRTPAQQQRPPCCTPASSPKRGSGRALLRASPRAAMCAGPWRDRVIAHRGRQRPLPLEIWLPPLGRLPITPPEAHGSRSWLLKP